MTDDHTIRQLVEELSGAALRDLLRNVRQHTELRRRIALGLLDERSVNGAYREYARREGPAYRQQVADLTLRYYRDLSDLGSSYSEQFYDEALADDALAGSPNGDGTGAGNHGHGWRPRSADGADATARRRRREVPADADGDRNGGDAEITEVPVELHGPPGREVVASFGLENTEHHPVRLTIDVGACRGPDEQTFIAPLTVQPAELELAPGEHRNVTMRLVMLPSVFVPGYLYRLPVNVRGAEELRLLVNIWSEEPDVGLRPDPNAPKPPDPPAAPEPGTATAEPADAAGPDTAGPNAAGPDTAAEAASAFVVRCPVCGRDFQRATRDARLRPHNTPTGDACPERRGRLRTAKQP